MHYDIQGYAQYLFCVNHFLQLSKIVCPQCQDSHHLHNSLLFKFDATFMDCSMLGDNVDDQNPSSENRISFSSKYTYS